MFAKTRIAIALVLALFATAHNSRAEVLLKATEFAPLQPVTGKSGKTVPIQATLYGKWYDTVTRKSWFTPLTNAIVTFEAYRKTIKSGNSLSDWGPVGRVVRTDADGIARTSYKLPSGAAKKLQGRYQATFPGGVFEGVLLRKNVSRTGDVIILP